MTEIKRSDILPWTESDIRSTPEATGVYILRDSENVMIYIGMSTNLRQRLLEHWTKKDIPGVAFFDWYQTTDEENARKLEEKWIKKYSPKYNVTQK